MPRGSSLAVSACAAALASTANAANWTVVAPNCATYVLGISSSSDDRVYAAGALNGIGNVVLESSDGFESFSKCLEHDGCLAPDLAMLLALAAGPVSEGTVATTGTLASAFSTDNGTTFTKNSPYAEETPIFSQDLSYNAKSGLFGTCGSYASNSTKSSIMTGAISHDGGASWSVGADATSVLIALNRYAAYPSAATWYMTAGEWPEDSVGAPPAEGETGVSQRLTLGPAGLHAAPRRPRAAATGNGEGGGYTAQVVKSTDGGATWASVFESSDGDYYFNGISCWDEDTCAVVGEGETAVVFVTTDGGATWDQVLNTGSSADSLMSVHMLGPASLWATGGTLSHTDFSGAVRRTEDLGGSWDVETVKDAYFFDVDVRGPGLAYAAALTRESTGSIAKYA